MRDDPVESGWLRPWLSRRAAGESFKLLPRAGNNKLAKFIAATRPKEGNDGLPV